MATLLPELLGALTTHGQQLISDATKFDAKSKVKQKELLKEGIL